MREPNNNQGSGVDNIFGNLSLESDSKISFVSIHIFREPTHASDIDNHAAEDPVAIYKTSHLLSLWHLSSSVSSFFKRACAAIHWG